MSWLMESGVEAEADAAPCDVIVAEFVFGGARCRNDAWHTVEWDGQRWRVCPNHLYGGAE